MAEARRTYLVTGATGNLGAAVVRALLLDDDSDVLAVVRPGREALLRWGLRDAGIDPAHRFTVVEGDIRQPHCGLDPAAFDGVTDIAHCAGDVRWRAPPGDLFATNVLGARHVLDLAHHVARAGTLHHVTLVSTAYVEPSRVDARNLTPATAYETSKLLMERLVVGSGLPVTIVRPSTIVGDSRTGRIENFSAAYFLLRMLHRRRIGFFPGHADALVDLMPVDHVAAAILDAHRRPGAPLVYATRGTAAETLAEVWRTAGDIIDELAPLTRARTPGLFVPPGLSALLLDAAGVATGRPRWRDLASYMPYLARRAPLTAPGAAAGQPPPIALRPLLRTMLTFALDRRFASTQRRFRDETAA